MRDKRIDELMHDEVDGVATPEESSRLREHLARDPEAKAAFEHLRQLSAMLDRVGMVDPPPDLKAGILRSIRTRATSESAHAGWRDRLAAAFGGRSFPRFAYAFAAGLAAGIIGFAVFSGGFAPMSQPGSDRFSGTMEPLFRSEAHRTLDARKFDFAEGEVAVETRRTDAGVAVVVEARSASEIALRLEFEPADYSVVGLTQGSGIQCRAMIGEGKVILTHSGEGRYVINLARRGQSTSPVRVSILAPDGPLEGVLRTDGAKSGK